MGRSNIKHKRLCFIFNLFIMIFKLKEYLQKIASNGVVYINLDNILKGF